MMDIELQQAAATKIMRLANEAGLIAIVWTVEDAKEAIERAAEAQGFSLKEDDALVYGSQLIEQNEKYIEEVSIERGWGALHSAAYDIVADAKGEK
jgi:hypothetical protein